MDSLAVSAGTDKSSLFHNYTKVYSQYFSNSSYAHDRKLNNLFNSLYAIWFALTNNLYFIAK